MTITRIYCTCATPTIAVRPSGTTLCRACGNPIAPPVAAVKDRP